MTPKTMSSSHPAILEELTRTRKVLQDLTDAVQTPRSGRQFFVAFKAALDLLAVNPVTESETSEPRRQYINSVCDRIIEMDGCCAHHWLVSVARHLKAITPLTAPVSDTEE